MRAAEAMRLPVLLAALQACAHADEEHEEHSHTGHPGHGHDHWSYKGKTAWPSAFPYCGGHMQSPINIDTAATHFSPQLTPLLLSGYSLPLGETLRLHNNGHTIVLDLPRNMMLTGGGFPQPYQAAQLHLHWGSEHSMAGSEHTVDGHRFAGEVHVVHYSSRFSHITEAEREPGGLAVLAAFLEVGPEENEPYQHILEHLEDVHEKGEETLIAGFDVATLLPNNLDRYFRYNGSLTTPPCYQTVNWTVFNQTIRLTESQIAVLDDTLQGDDDQPLQTNFRLPQGLHGRSVLASFRMLHPAEEAPPPDEGDPPRTPVLPGPTEGSYRPDSRGGHRTRPSIPGGATGQDPDGPASKPGPGKQEGSSLRTAPLPLQDFLPPPPRKVVGITTAWAALAWGSPLARFPVSVFPQETCWLFSLELSLGSRPSRFSSISVSTGARSTGWAIEQRSPAPSTRQPRPMKTLSRRPRRAVAGGVSAAGSSLPHPRSTPTPHPPCHWAPLPPSPSLCQVLSPGWAS